MALDVYITLPGEKPWTGELVAHFEDDGDFHYLQAFWPASSSNGRAIDLYGDARFHGANLAQLRGCLLRAEASLSGRPDRWAESVGSTLGPEGNGRTPRMTTRSVMVHKGRLAARIATLLQAVDRAASNSLELHFLGD